MLTWPTPSLPSSPWRTAFSTRGWIAQVGHRHRQHLGRDEQRDLQPLAEPRLLQREVALDVAQLLGQGGERPAAAEARSG